MNDSGLTRIAESAQGDTSADAERDPDASKDVPLGDTGLIGLVMLAEVMALTRSNTIDRMIPPDLAAKAAAAAAAPLAGGVIGPIAAPLFNEYLLAFSCKGRWFCPSCHQKRSSSSARCSPRHRSVHHVGVTISTPPPGQSAS